MCGVPRRRSTREFSATRGAAAVRAPGAWRRRAACAAAAQRWGSARSSTASGCPARRGFPCPEARGLLALHEGLIRGTSDDTPTPSDLPQQTNAHYEKTSSNSNCTQSHLKALNPNIQINLAQPGAETTLDIFAKVISRVWTHLY